MKLTCFIIFLFFGFKCAGQNPAMVKVIISYVKSHNSWGDPGIYGRSEKIELIATNTGSFKISRHILFYSSAGEDGKTYTHDSTVLSVDLYPMIAGQKILNLISALNKNEDNFNVAYLRPYLKMSNRKHIDSIAKKIEFTLFFDPDFKDERKAAYKKIKNFDRLDSFLNLQKPDTNYYMVVSDGTERLTISTINHRSDTTNYTSQLYHFMGQPFYKTSNNPKSLKPNIAVLNLAINSSLLAILPMSSLLRQNVDFRTVTDKYLNWYLDKDVWYK